MDKGRVGVVELGKCFWGTKEKSGFGGEGESVVNPGHLGPHLPGEAQRALGSLATPQGDACPVCPFLEGCLRPGLP